LGHEWLLVYPLLDNARFVKNLIEWLKQGRGGKILYTTGHREWFNAQNSEALANELKKFGLEIEPLVGTIAKSELDGASVLIIGNAWGAFSPDEINVVKARVAAGAGLLLAGLGWSWAGSNPEKASPENVMQTYPMTRMAEPYGIHWLDSVITDPDPQYSFDDPPASLQAQFKGSPEFHTFFPNARR
jgi:hypothetical protein